MGGLIVMERKPRESIGCPDVKHKGKESAGCGTDWGTFDLYIWPWIFKAKLYLGNGRPDCHGTKGTEVDRMPWCGTQPLCDLKAEDIVRDQGELRWSVSADSSSLPLFFRVVLLPLGQSFVCTNFSRVSLEETGKNNLASSKQNSGKREPSAYLLVFLLQYLLYKQYMWICEIKSAPW